MKKRVKIEAFRETSMKTLKIIGIIVLTYVGTFGSNLRQLLDINEVNELIQLVGSNLDSISSSAAVKRLAKNYLTISRECKKAGKMYQAQKYYHTAVALYPEVEKGYKDGVFYAWNGADADFTWTREREIEGLKKTSKVSVVPSSKTLVKGDPFPLQAIALRADNSFSDITGSPLATWGVTGSDQQVLNGLFIPGQAGNYEVYILYGPYAGSARISVVNGPIDLDLDSVYSRLQTAEYSFDDISVSQQETTPAYGHLVMAD